MDNIAEHDNILEGVSHYYTGLSDEQCRVLDKLTNCIDEMLVIDQMIGMDEIKGEFVRLLKFLSTIEPGELKKNSFLMHMVIMGPPGHGKTEIAKLLGNALKKSGLLTSDKFVVATRADLIGKYCGHTARDTTAVFDRARGGVIFIDEVYALGNPEKQDVFTGECINTINQLLSERTDTLCIVAGYENEIDTCFFSYNPGLERRFPWRFNIKPYTEQDLVDIFHKKLKDTGQSAMPDALFPSDIKKHKELFSNAGGDIVNLVTNCMLSYYDNLFLQGPAGRPINRADVLGGMKRYIANRKTAGRSIDSGPPSGMYL
jgi:SpoVK/Ycf46/Vps4 family AAA+-type ATPase